MRLFLTEILSFFFLRDLIQKSISISVSGFSTIWKILHLTLICVIMLSDTITFLDRYMRYPLYLISDYSYYPGDNYALDYTRMNEKHHFSQEDFEKKKDFCGIVVSRGGCKEREEFVNILNSYKTVQSGGKWNNNIGGPVANKFDFLSTCKFSVAFENSVTPGYCTEKLMQAFAAKTIPIYFGDATVGTQFNSKAIINVHEYSSYEDALKRIIEIDEDDELYLRIIREEAMLPGYAEKKKLELDAFLRHIVDQNPQDAFRRSGPLLEAYEKI